MSTLISIRMLKLSEREAEPTSVELQLQVSSLVTWCLITWTRVLLAFERPVRVAFSLRCSLIAPTPQILRP